MQLNVVAVGFLDCARNDILNFNLPKNYPLEINCEAAYLEIKLNC